MSKINNKSTVEVSVPKSCYALSAECSHNVDSGLTCHGTGATIMKKLTQQDLADLVEGAAIFSSGGGGDPQIGSNIVETLREDHCPVRLIDATEVPDKQIVINFACVGACGRSLSQ